MAEMVVIMWLFSRLANKNMKEAALLTALGWSECKRHLTYKVLIYVYAELV